MLRAQESLATMHRGKDETSIALGLDSLVDDMQGNYSTIYIRRVFEALDPGRGPIREHTSSERPFWGADRFSSGPAPDFRTVFTDDIAATDDDALYQTHREFGWEARIPRGYRIPLPGGQYRVTLHFAEIVASFHNAAQGTRNFHIHLEGDRVRKSYEVSAAGFATADPQKFEVSVKDGVLDIELVSRLRAPMISASCSDPSKASPKRRGCTRGGSASRHPTRNAHGEGSEVTRFPSREETSLEGPSTFKTKRSWKARPPCAW